MNIRNHRDLSAAYELLNFARKNGYEKHFADLKKEIRAYNNRPANPERIIRDYGIDGFISLFPLPTYLESVEDATEYFEECEYIHCPASVYDCTGHAFTSWYKIFSRNGQFWAYHSVGFDV